jgi:anti-anti-sigma factor
LTVRASGASLICRGQHCAVDRNGRHHRLTSEFQSAVSDPEVDVPYTIPFSCRWSDSGVGAAWVRVAGELDLVTSPELAATLHAAQLNASKVVLDLRALSSIDSAGASVITAAATRAHSHGQRLMIVRGDPDVDEVLTRTGPTGDLETFDLQRSMVSSERARETMGLGA